VFLLGTRTGQLAYGDWKLFRPDATIIHLDIDAAELGRNLPTALPLLGDVRDSLRELLAGAEGAGLKRADRGNGGRIASLREDWRRRNAALAASDAVPIRPERLFAEIDRAVEGASLVVADASYSTAWALSHIDVPDSRRFILSPRGTGSIGWGFSAAIGAALGAPDRHVISVSGDGGFGYAIAELETAARHRVALSIVVLNNSTLGYQRHWEEKLMGSYRDCDYAPVDYAAVARAMGCGGERVADPAEIAPALARARAAGRPYVLDIVTDPDVPGPVTGMDRDKDVAEIH
jgi:acetolactate synthase-1/2/3 large subunit